MERVTTEAARPAATDGSEAEDELAGLRATIETLAAFERGATSEGERRAAEWIAERLIELGAVARVEEERAFTSWAGALAGLSAAGAVAGVAGLAGRGRSRIAAAIAAVAGAAIADDISNGPRLARRATMTQQPTWNVVGEVGPNDAPRTVVVLAHHDAAPTGRIFDQSFQRWLGSRFPGIVERVDTALPLWWPVVGGPAAVAYGAARGRRGADRHGPLPLRGLRRRFRRHRPQPDRPRRQRQPDRRRGAAGARGAAAREPEPGVRVLLVSCGAEETLQGGIHGFAARHFDSLDRERTSFVNLDTLGSPRLVLLEGEGPLVMEDYTDRTFRDLVARAAERAGVRMRRGMRARSSTDAVIPSRARFPTATLMSVDRNKLLSNYHLMTDTPENVDYRTVLDAIAVTEAVIRDADGT